MKAWVIVAAGWLAFSAVACGGSSSKTEGKDELYLNTDLLDAVEATFIKGRCLGRLTVSPDGDGPSGALLAVAREVAGTIPLDGSAPASDQALVALVPATPLSGALAAWEEDLSDQVTGPWLETETAFDWIDGSGGPFDDNGFEAVAGERYSEPAEGWSLELELVNMGSVSGAEAAFTGAGWDAGTLQ